MAAARGGPASAAARSVRLCLLQRKVQAAELLVLPLQSILHLQEMGRGRLGLNTPAKSQDSLQPCLQKLPRLRAP